MVEQWRDIPGFEGSYQASNMGNVRSVSRKVQGKDGYIRRYEGKTLRPNLDIKGYPTIGLNSCGKRYTFKVHRVVAMSFLPDYDPLLHVDHINGIKHDNRAENLRMVTNQENQYYRRVNGGYDKKAKFVCQPYKEVESLPGEEWRAVKDIEGYEVSNLGRVKSIDRWIERKDGVRQFLHGKILKQKLNTHGYYVLFIKKNGIGINKSVHRMVAEAFLPQPEPQQTMVDHIDGNRTNNRVTNLRFCTPKENVRYAIESGALDVVAAAKLGGAATTNKRPVMRNDGKRYASCAEAARDIGCYGGEISSVAGGRRRSCRGYSFTYIESDS